MRGVNRLVYIYAFHFLNGEHQPRVYSKNKNELTLHPRRSGFHREYHVHSKSYFVRDSTCFRWMQADTGKNISREREGERWRKGGREGGREGAREGEGERELHLNLDLPYCSRCVSVGNVAQLAVDLLINTLSLSRAGHLHHPSILPLAGSGAYSHTPHSLHTAAEGGDWCVDIFHVF